MREWLSMVMSRLTDIGYNTQSTKWPIEETNSISMIHTSSFKGRNQLQSYSDE